MPKAFAHVPVPKFSASEIALAEVCAAELWNGLDYQTGKELNVSDEDLLVMFATPTFAMYNSTTTKQTFSEPEGVSVFLWARRFNNFIPEPA